MVVLALGLSGCDAMTQQVLDNVEPKEPSTVVLSPGHRIYVGDEAVPIVGFDVCPADGGFFGPRVDAGEMGCVVVSNTTTEVRVKLALSTGLIEETWTVMRTKKSTKSGHFYERTYLLRPDKSMVLAAPPQGF